MPLTEKWWRPEWYRQNPVHFTDSKQNVLINIGGRKVAELPVPNPNTRRCVPFPWLHDHCSGDYATPFLSFPMTSKHELPMKLCACTRNISNRHSSHCQCDAVTLCVQKGPSRKCFRARTQSVTDPTPRPTQTAWHAPWRSQQRRHPGRQRTSLRMACTHTCNFSVNLAPLTGMRSHSLAIAWPSTSGATKSLNSMHSY